MRQEKVSSLTELGEITALRDEKDGMSNTVGL